MDVKKFAKAVCIWLKKMGALTKMAEQFTSELAQVMITFFQVIIIDGTEHNVIVIV